MARNVRQRAEAALLAIEAQPIAQNQAGGAAGALSDSDSDDVEVENAPQNVGRQEPPSNQSLQGSGSAQQNEEPPSNQSLQGSGADRPAAGDGDVPTMGKIFKLASI